ncbi:hypothetical protein BGW80DRAFT_137157 [Lactifluus volemus]|nr:hypothetical protein BGW80DRAFT_137157 [Lactifluus volemus]
MFPDPSQLKLYTFNELPSCGYPTTPVLVHCLPSSPSSSSSRSSSTQEKFTPLQLTISKSNPDSADEPSSTPWRRQPLESLYPSSRVVTTDDKVIVVRVISPSRSRCAPLIRLFHSPHHLSTSLLLLDDNQQTLFFFSFFIQDVRKWGEGMKERKRGERDDNRLVRPYSSHTQSHELELSLGHAWARRVDIVFTSDT